ncbi:Hypothetical predicted protein [Pelobates cultripes]|uniref:Uncharacterized protein n=1 Tax=Pelobates cultripes TaxID=61616 RepID=A0AAD1WQA5_PELCU|nr:Hypothetical predicted protein [Pelobates cultripes]
MQALFDTSVCRSIMQAMVSAMSAMLTSLSHTITQALLQAQQSAQQTVMSTASTPTPVSQSRKAPAKTKHSSKTKLTDSLPAVMDGGQPTPRKRATSRAKSARQWKWARAQLDSSESDLRNIEEEIDESIMDTSYNLSESDSDGAIGEASVSSLSTFPAMMSR